MAKNRFEVLFEDEHLLVLSKPAGWLSVPDRYDPTIPSLSQVLREKREWVAPVHRLDKDTSGIICFAKSEDTHKELNTQFRERTVDKIYQAIVLGVPSSEAGEITAPLLPHPAKPGRMIVHHGEGKAAHTKYKTLESFQGAAWLEIDLLTGRTHQIRVHLAHIGYPLLVDPFYGTKDRFFVSEIKGRRYRLGKGEEERPLLKRTSLHAQKLTFTHPANGERLTFSAEMPKDMRATLQQLRKWAAGESGQW